MPGFRPTWPADREPSEDELLAAIKDDADGVRDYLCARIVEAEETAAEGARDLRRYLREYDLDDEGDVVGLWDHRFGLHEEPA